MSAGFNQAWAKYQCGRYGHIFRRLTPNGPQRCDRCQSLDRAERQEALHSWQQTADACEMDNARLRGEILKRRDCLLGARETCQLVLPLLDSSTARAAVEERIGLLTLAIEQTDEALDPSSVQALVDAELIGHAQDARDAVDGAS